MSSHSRRLPSTSYTRPATTDTITDLFDPRSGARYFEDSGECSLHQIGPQPCKQCGVLPGLALLWTFKARQPGFWHDTMS
eukprot:2421164-Amphidinium_carterae.1